MNISALPKSEVRKEKVLTKENKENLTLDLDANLQPKAEEISKENKILNQEIHQEGKSIIKL